MVKATVLLLLVAFVTVAVCKDLSDPNANKKCIDGKRYNDGCNWCTCMNGNVACTLMACYETDPETGKPQFKKALPPPEDFWRVE